MADNSVLVPSIIGFSSTSVDDFAVMLVYFAKAQMLSNPRAGYIKVITAQTLALIIVLIISLVGIILGILLPMSYIDLIGVLPLLIGCVQLYDAMYEYCYPPNHGISEASSYDALSHDMDDDELFALEPPLWFEEENILIDDRNSAYRVKTPTINKPYNPRNVRQTLSCCQKIGVILYSVFDPFTFEVLVFALVCSCDNIAIYVAMFAAMQPWEIILVSMLFFVLLGVTIIVSIIIMQYRPLVQCFSSQSKLLVPTMFIGLGIYILSHSIISPWPQLIAD